MSITEVSKLIDAGFTKEEILALVPDSGLKDEHSKEVSENNSEKINFQEQDPAGTDPDQQDVKAENTNIKEEVQNGAISQLNDSINKLIRVIQSNNLQTAFTEGKSVDIKNEVDDIMKSIIRPTTKK